MITSGGTTTLGLYDNVSEIGKKADITYVNDLISSTFGGINDELSLKAEKSYVDNQDALKADTAYVNAQDSLKADKTYVDTALSQLSTAATKFYPTLAEANADIANLEVNQPVQVGEAANGGLWYKATAEATSLTKSAYDPLTQAQAAIPQNLLFDPFSETVDASSKTDTLQGYKNAEFSNKLTSSSNAYFGKPTLQGAASQRVARYIDVKKLGLDVGQSFYARVKSHFNGVDGTSRITVASYKADGTVLQNTLKLPITGVNDIVSDVITITSDTAYIGVLLPSATDKELIAVSFSTLNKPKFVYGAIAPSIVKSNSDAIVANSLAVASADTKATKALNNAAHNVFPDPFFRLHQAGIKKHNGYNFMQSENYQVTEYSSSPFPSKLAVRIENTAEEKLIDLKSLGLKAGDTLTVRLLIVSNSAMTIRFDGYLRQNTSTILGSATDTKAYTANESRELVFNYTITSEIATNLNYLQLRFNQTAQSGIFRICGIVGYVNDTVTPMKDAQVEQDKETIAVATGYTLNLAPDPFFRQYKAGITTQDGYPVLNESNWTISADTSSPYDSKVSLRATDGARKHHNFNLLKLGFKVGDTLTLRTAVRIFTDANYGVGLFVRNSSNTVVGSAINTRINLKSGVITEFENTIALTSDMLADGNYLQVRFNIDETVLSEWRIYGWAIYRNKQNLGIVDTDQKVDANRILLQQTIDKINEVPYTYGGWFLQETRQRIRKLLLGEVRQLTIYNEGDSWSHNVNRWVNPVATTLMSELGDGGGGWVGFGFQTENTALFNGNIRPSLYGYTWEIGKWTGNYGFSHSPDICQADSNVVGAKITCTSPPAGSNVSGVDLFYIGGSGVIRYRFNSGAWTTFNLDVTTTGDLAITALTGFTALNNTLEIEVVSGSVSLCGINWKSNANGVVWHKTGASGSLASRWADSDPANWGRGVDALKPDFTIILHGTNDQIANKRIDQFDTALRKLVTNTRSARPDIDILIVMPCINGRDAEFDVTMTEYTRVAYNVARDLGCAFLDLQKVFGKNFAQYASGSSRNWFHEDKIHPRPETGGRVIADAIYRFIMYDT